MGQKDHVQQSKVSEALDVLKFLAKKKPTDYEECPYCKAKTPSQALHIFTCPALDTEHE